MPAIIFLSINAALQKREESTTNRILMLICLFNAILYASYKVAQANEAGHTFDIFTNLPLHFCNLNLILLPLAIHKKSKVLLAYQLYFGVPLAALALITVYPAFISRPIWHFTPFVYFFYHSMLVVLPLILIKYKFYTPSFKAVWQPALLLVALTAIMHIVNMIFRATQIANQSNYFFTYGLEGDFFTELLWRILPYNFFFLLPALLLFVPYIILTTLPFHLKENKKKRKS